ncbi:DUF3800 domain-containing protein [Variovorax sp. JS1663]|uniref:DUF3800 domain-containing protein n=1 Tax=Variovorax sp. JS1663 TaxID=1851577 RepID=UPI000B666505|nr:DUF3800 domain-containing protein [Variovorax sp. JS1663]OUM01776.1 3-deoxy-D-manno-octulosonic acid transferase [Variovorax sp. JS1663]
MLERRREEQLGLFAAEHQPLGKTDDAVQAGSRDSSYVVYVDESGDHSMVKVDANYPVFVLAFCVFHKKYYSENVVPAVEKFKFRHFGHDQVVLHEREIRMGSGEFNFFRNREHHQAFIEDLTSIIDSSNFILISCVVDKTKLAGQKELPENLYHLALGQCLDSLYDFLKEKNQEDLRTHIVVECRGHKEDRDLELEFRRICDSANRTGGRLPYNIVFADKKANAHGLQLVDLVARPIGIHTVRPHQSNRAFDILKAKFYCEGGRRTAGAGYEKFGLKRYP